MQNRSIDFIRQTPSSFYTNIYELLVSGWMDISTHDTRTVVLSPWLTAGYRTYLFTELVETNRTIFQRIFSVTSRLRTL